MFGWLGTVKTEFVSEQEVSAISILKFTKFLTLIEIVRLSPVKGTKGWLGCSRSDLTLGRGKWRGVSYGFIPSELSSLPGFVRVANAVTGKGWARPLELWNPLWEWVTGGLAAFLRLPLTGVVWEIWGIFIRSAWNVTSNWWERILTFSLLQLLNLVGPFTLEPSRKFFDQALQFGRILKNLQIRNVLCG